MTETAPGATTLPPAIEGQAGQLRSAALLHRVRIADPAGVVLPAGEIGQIEIKGPNVIPGYWNLPAATAEAFTPTRWFRSGDLGHLDAGRLPLRLRPAQGHDHLGRREHLPGRNRAGSARSTESSRRRDRGARRQVG